MDFRKQVLGWGLLKWRKELAGRQEVMHQSRRSKVLKVLLLFFFSSYFLYWLLGSYFRMSVSVYCIGSLNACHRVSELNAYIEMLQEFIFMVPKLFSGPYCKGVYSKNTYFPDMLLFLNWDQEIKCFQEVGRCKPKLNLSFFLVLC